MRLSASISDVSCELAAQPDSDAASPNSDWPRASSEPRLGNSAIVSALGSGPASTGAAPDRSRPETPPPDAAPAGRGSRHATPAHVVQGSVAVSHASWRYSGSPSDVRSATSAA
eukprot:199277-Chlamydomonas_euryale.AAC.5